MEGIMRARERIIDEMLVLAAQAGQIEAFEALAERWNPRLSRLAWRLTGDREGAQEAVQEAWVAVARGLRQLQDPSCFGPWALRIVNRRSADWIKQRGRTRQRNIELSAASQAQARSCGGSDAELSVQEALNRLDAGQRAVLDLFYIEALTVAEISQILEIPVGTVKSRLYHAREQMRVLLEA
jgi:RNA polymerase sigma factor (sigma-70 family)